MKKFVSLLLAVLMLATCTSALAETTLTAIWRLPATFQVEDNPVIKAWGERTGVTLEIEAPPISNYTDRLNIVMASGDLPDIINVQNFDSTFQQWARDGLLLDLTDYFTPEKMPVATSVLTAEELASCYVDGRLYALPRAQAKPYDAIIYRGDWLEKLGLEVPTTPAEFAEVMAAFATQDPDGNGLNDTYGIYQPPRNMEDRNLINAFGIRPSSVPDENGEYQLMQAQEGYMAYLDWMNEMYAAGSIHPEWYLAQSYEDQDLFYAGKLGAVYTDCTINHLITFANNETFKAANPDAYLVVGPALHAEGEEIAQVYYPPQVWGGCAINADSENIDAAIALLDDGYTNECVTLLFKGIEGVTYTSLDPETRVLTATSEQAALGNNVLASSYLCINYQLEDKGIVISGGTSTTEEDTLKWVEASNYVQSVEKRISYLGESTLAGYADLSTKLTNDGVYSEFNEMRTKYICGQISHDEMAAYLQDVYAPACEGIMTLIRESGINK